MMQKYVVCTHPNQGLNHDRKKSSGIPSSLMERTPKLLIQQTVKHLDQQIFLNACDTDTFYR